MSNIYRQNNINSLPKNQEIFNILFTCNCCENHQINKPKNINDFYDTLSPKPFCHKKCDCACRSYLRWICRINQGFVPSNSERFIHNINTLCIKIQKKNELNKFMSYKDEKIIEDEI